MIRRFALGAALGAFFLWLALRNVSFGEIAVTLEQAAKMLAEAEAAKSEPIVEAAAQAPAQAEAAPAAGALAAGAPAAETPAAAAAAEAAAPVAAEAVAVEAPADSPPVRVQPIVLGLGKPDTRPPYEILRRYVEAPAEDGEALIYVPPQPAPPAVAAGGEEEAAEHRDLGEDL